jgi:hypothetical protein
MRLLKRDRESEEQSKWLWLRSELKAGLEADEAEFMTLDAGKIIKEAKTRRKADDHRATGHVPVQA